MHAEAHCHCILGLVGSEQCSKQGAPIWAAQVVILQVRGCCSSGSKADQQTPLPGLGSTTRATSHLLAGLKVTRSHWRARNIFVKLTYLRSKDPAVLWHAVLSMSVASCRD